MNDRDYLERLGDRLAAVDEAVHAGDTIAAAHALGGASYWYCELAGHDWQPLTEQVPA